MAEGQSQPDLDPAAMGQLIDALAPLMPALERLVEVWKQREKEPTTCQQPAVFNTFSDQEDYMDLSESNRQRLPGVYQGRSRRENLRGFHQDTLREVGDRRRFGTFAQYETCSEIFTPEQWKVIYLYWNQGMTQAEIAKTLGLKRSAVSGRLTRAATRKEQYDKRMRQEQLEHLKKMQKESYE